MNTYEIGKIVTDHFAVKKSYIGITRSDRNYLDLLLTDGKTDLQAKQWDFTGEAPKENTVIYVQALVNQYRGKLQLIIQRISQAKDGEYEPSKFIPVCKINRDMLIDDFVTLKDVFYIQVNQPLQPVGKSQPETQLVLTKLGLQEIHGPKDEMVINREQILYIEELREDSQVVQGIKQFKETQAKQQPK